MPKLFALLFVWFFAVVSVAAETTAFQVSPEDPEPGGEVVLEITFALQDEEAIFARRSHLGGRPTVLRWDYPEAFTKIREESPAPQAAELGGIEEFFHFGETTFRKVLKAPEEGELSGTFALEAEWVRVDSEGRFHAESDRWEVVMGTGEMVVTGEEPADSEAAGTTRESYPLSTILVSILLGFVGGLILNAMPCILPVIGIKVMSLVQHAGDSPGEAKKHGWVFTAGVVVSFWILAGIVAIVQAGGTALGQGFQLQNFPFVLFMTSVIFLLALSMMGVFMIDIGSGGYQKANQLAGKKGYSGSFFNGFLVTLLATPCSAPILAGAMTFAFTQPPLLSFVMFTSIALGLAFPFTLLGHKPQWTRFIPKPGPWMEYFKQSMGFVMMVMVLFLLTVVNALRGGEAVVWTALWLWVLGLVAWIYGAFVTGKKRSTRRKAWAFASVILAIGIFGVLEGPLKWRLGNAEWAAERGYSTEISEEMVASTKGGVISWYDFTPDRLETLLERDKVVFINMTAAWCATCKVNERVAIEREGTRELMEEHGIIAVYGDWTDQNEEIRSYLESYNRVGVPLNVIYGKDRDNPIILPELFSQSRLHSALREAAKSFQ
ncbi:MAG: thioredoxin family protein [Opitutales bacterium]|nr:thioredoxin family protein [Opitutales bacterium]MCH8540609.1 thioredoxin family protein [Opitutales bacterium]